MQPEDLELNKRQINALLALEAAFIRCGRTQIAIYGKGKKLLAYNGLKLDHAKKKRQITIQRTEFGQVPYVLIADAGTYKNSGRDIPFYIKKRKRRR